jgi:hypothetical protein
MKRNRNGSVQAMNKRHPDRERQYCPNVPLAEEVREKYERNLIPGAMFVLKTTLRVMPDTGHEPPPFPYVNELWYASPRPIAGTIGHVAIYTGLVRVEEIYSKGHIRVPRHSFIINGGRYLVTNLNLLDPITQELSGHT